MPTEVGIMNYELKKIKIDREQRTKNKENYKIIIMPAYRGRNYELKK